MFVCSDCAVLSCDETNRAEVTAGLWADERDADAPPCQSAAQIVRNVANREVNCGGQLGVGLAWELNARVNLGVSYRFMMVNSADFGVATFSDPALVGIASVQSDSVFTHAIQATLSIEF